VLARRFLAISPDKTLGKRIAVALKAAGGVVDLHAAMGELGSGEITAALVVVHLDGELVDALPDLLARLSGETKVIAILPRTNLAATVDIMQASERVAGMMVAEELEPRRLSGLATRVVAGDIFGLEKLVLWGTHIHSFLVGDYQEKSLCIAQVSELAEAMGVRRKYRESIEQCLDEMLMNALYDAPVDEHGRQIFSEIPTKTRISLRVEQKVVVQYACDGAQFAVAVRDAFGTLERATVLRYLHKCLHNEQQIDRKAGGAGLGLYLMTNGSSEVYFNVLPGVATEAVCVFDLEQPKLQLVDFGFFLEKIDAAGRLASGPSRRLPVVGHPVERRLPTAPPTPRGLIAVLSAAILATLALIAVVAWPRFFAGPHRASVTVHTVDGATVEVEGRNAGIARAGTLVLPDLEVGRPYPIAVRRDGYEPGSAIVQAREGGSELTLQLAALAASVVLDTMPTGASVAIDGKPAGTTPVSITTLAPGANVEVAFERAGYQRAVTTLVVPKPGRETRLVQPLVVTPELARVKLVSDPPGAQVAQNGQLLVGVTTPAEVLVEAGKAVRFTLALPDHVPASLEPITPSRGDQIEREAKLVRGAALHVTATVEARASVSGAPHCQTLATPATCVLAPGKYTVEVTTTPPGRFTKKLAMTTRAQDVALELGIVEAPSGKTLQVGDGPAMKKLVLEAGTRQVGVTDESGTHTVAVTVKAGATTIVK
jgi:PEGA domain-containing protein